MMRTDLEDDIVGDQSASPENGKEDGGLGVEGIHAYLRWLLLSGLVCFGFAAVASIVISLQLWLMEYPEEGGCIKRQRQEMRKRYDLTTKRSGTYSVKTEEACNECGCSWESWT